MLTASTRVRPAPRTVARWVRGELVVVSMPSFEAHVLNGAGARVWEAIVPGITVRELSAIVELADPDLHSFLVTLIDQGLIQAD